MKKITSNHHTKERSLRVRLRLRDVSVLVWIIVVSVVPSVAFGQPKQWTEEELSNFKIGLFVIYVLPWVPMALWLLYILLCCLKWALVPQKEDDLTQKMDAESVDDVQVPQTRQQGKRKVILD